MNWNFRVEFRIQGSLYTENSDFNTENREKNFQIGIKKYKILFFSYKNLKVTGIPKITLIKLKKNQNILNIPGNDGVRTRPCGNCIGNPWANPAAPAPWLIPPMGEGVGVLEGVGGDDESDGLEDPRPKYSSVKSIWKNKEK